MPRDNQYDEAARIMTICNACRYCEGHCAVFPAMEKMLRFSSTDMDYLANLCHNCGSCYQHCQYAPPHEFQVNVPAVLEDVREATYERYAWPQFLGRAFVRNGLWTSILFIIVLTGFIGSTALFTGPEVFFGTHDNSFYGVIPHSTMVTLFGSVSLFVLIALLVPLYRYWRALELPSPGKVGINTILAGLSAALTLRNLGGGAGEGCTYPQERPSGARRVHHHLVFYGFLACFAATSIATVYHYGLSWPAPYPWNSLPKLFGIPGGIAMVIGTSGLFYLKRVSQLPEGNRQSGMNTALLFALFATSLTGLVLMLVKNTPLLGLTLSLHLGSVLALFLCMPYGKFVHGFYRIVALIAHARENETIENGGVANREGNQLAS